MKASAVLVKARDVLENTGWCKNHLFRNKKDGTPTAPCADGAVRVAVGAKLHCDPEYDWELAVPGSRVSDYNKARALLKEVGRTVFSVESPFAEVEGFNDSYGVTKKDVLQWFDAAIATAQVRERRGAREAAEATS